MATDLWMLERVREAAIVPPPHREPATILRFYQWRQPTLSLGFHQAADSLPEGIERVRRPTGGRAVLHQATGVDSDLTYSLAATRSGGSRRQTYRALCQFLMRGLAHLGVDLEFGTAGRGYVGEASCFRTATTADLCWQGRKAIGSAQLWRGNALLQHGTILLRPDRATWEAVLPGSSQHVVGLNEINSRSLSVTDIISSLSASARDYFPVEWQERSLDASARASISSSTAQFSLAGMQSL